MPRYFYSTERKLEWIQFYFGGKSSYEIPEIVAAKYQSEPVPAQKTILKCQ